MALLIGILFAAIAVLLLRGAFAFARDPQTVGIGESEGRRVNVRVEIACTAFAVFVLFAIYLYLT